MIHGDQRTLEMEKKGMNLKSRRFTGECDGTLGVVQTSQGISGSWGSLLPTAQRPHCGFSSRGLSMCS